MNKKRIILSSLIASLLLTGNIFCLKKIKQRRKCKCKKSKTLYLSRRRNPRRCHFRSGFHQKSHLLGTETNTSTNANYQNNNNLLRNLNQNRQNRSRNLQIIKNQTNSSNKKKDKKRKKKRSVQTNSNFNTNWQRVIRDQQRAYRNLQRTNRTVIMQPNQTQTSQNEENQQIQSQTRQDAFVRNLVNANLITNRRRLQNGDYLLQVRSVNQGDRRIPRNLRGQICPAMALRSVQLMINYFANNEDQNYLNRINSLADTTNFLINLRLQNIAHANLHSGQIENILSNDSLSTLDTYNTQTNANSNNVMVADSLEDLVGGSRYNITNRGNIDLATLTLRIQSANDGFYHGFVIGTNRNGGGHWISGAVYRRNGVNYWFVVESGTPNRLNLLALVRQRISTLDPELG